MWYHSALKRKDMLIDTWMNLGTKPAEGSQTLCDSACTQSDSESSLVVTSSGGERDGWGVWWIRGPLVSNEDVLELDKGGACIRL